MGFHEILTNHRGLVLNNTFLKIPDCIAHLIRITDYMRINMHVQRTVDLRLQAYFLWRMA